MPYSSRFRKPVRYNAASRSVLDGSVPVWTPAPPTAGAFSMMATFFPKYAACAAPFSPAGPEPMTIRSKCSTSSILSAVYFNRILR